MITALQTPAAGAIMLDANNSNIIVQSDNGAGFYFRAVISIDGAEFDTQGWSRIDAHTAVADLKKLYYAYFNPVFVQGFANGLTEQTHLVRSVSIVVKEYALANPAVVVQSLALPVFKIMYCVKPQVISFAPGVRTLGLEAKTMVVPANGKIVVPIYVNSAFGQSLNVNLKTNAGTTVNTQSIFGVSGKKVYLYQFDLAGASIGYNTLYLTLSISLGMASIPQSVIYRINRLPNFPFKEIAFRNNFGYYLYAYPDGEMETVSNLSPETYETINGDVPYEVNEEAVYSINTGSYKTPEKPILTMVANSLDTWLKIGTTWLKMVTQTKKVTTFRDRLHQYSAELQFKLKLGTDVENTGMIQNASALPDIHITGTDVAGNVVTLSFEYNNGFTAAALVLKFRNVLSTGWSLIYVPAPVSPIVITITPNDYFMQLQEDGNPLNVSNQVSVTV